MVDGFLFVVFGLLEMLLVDVEFGFELLQLLQLLKFVVEQVDFFA
jgi:hypothetical protein